MTPKTSHSDLRGDAFQRAHLALKKRNKPQLRWPIAIIIQDIAIAIGILIACISLGSCLDFNVDGNGWAVGNYRTAAPWND